MCLGKLKFRVGTNQLTAITQEKRIFEKKNKYEIDKNQKSIKVNFV